MADKRLYELEELTTPQSSDLLLIEQSSNNTDKKIKLENLVPNDVIESAVDNWLDDHPEATTTVEDGSITPAKLHQDTLDMFDEKANIDGYYDEMAVGSAEQLLSNTYIPDSDPYLYRTSGGSLEIGDRVYEDAIVGGSVAWNQLVQNGNFASVANWSTSGVTYSVNNNIAHVVKSGTGSTSLYQEITKQIGHKYLLSFEAYGEDSFRLAVNWGNAISGLDITTTKKVFNIVYNGTTGPNENFNFFTASSILEQGDGFYLKNVQLIDLTLALGSTIADYAYTLEQNEAGSGIAWLKSQGFFGKDYYAYNAGGIQSVKTSAKKVVGFNQWDEVWETGSYNLSTGEKTVNANCIRCKNLIPILPNTIYYFGTQRSLPSSTFYVVYFNKNGNYVGNNITGTYNTTKTTPADAYYMGFWLGNSSNPVTSNTYDICINFHWDGERDGEYEPYVEHTYPLDSDLELRGIPKLVDGKIKYDGDLYASDGTVTRRYGIVDLGSLTYTKATGFTTKDCFYASINSLPSYPKNISSTTIPNAISARFLPTYQNASAWDINTFVFTVGAGVLPASSLGFIVPLNAYQDASAFKTAMSGVYLVYELATATTESADPYTNPQIVDNWGTEEFVDTRDVPVPVGHESRYLPDLKAKLESAPNNPSTNGKYFLQYQNGEATYVPVPSEVPQTPSEDGTYVLKATVSSGTATLAWVAEE